MVKLAPTAWFVVNTTIVELERSMGSINSDSNCAFINGVLKCSLISGLNSKYGLYRGNTATRIELTFLQSHTRSYIAHTTNMMASSSLNSLRMQNIFPYGINLSASRTTNKLISRESSQFAALFEETGGNRIGDWESHSESQLITNMLHGYTPGIGLDYSQE